METLTGFPNLPALFLVSHGFSARTRIGRRVQSGARTDDRVGLADVRARRGALALVFQGFHSLGWQAWLVVEDVWLPLVVDARSCHRLLSVEAEGEYVDQDLQGCRNDARSPRRPGHELDASVAENDAGRHGGKQAGAWRQPVRLARLLREHGRLTWKPWEGFQTFPRWYAPRKARRLPTPLRRCCGVVHLIVVADTPADRGCGAI